MMARSPWIRSPEFEPALPSSIRASRCATSPHDSGYDSAGGSYEFDAQGRVDSWNPGPRRHPIFPPGTKFRYWDDAMSQFGQVLTKAAGQTLDQLFRARIREPIGMTRWRWTSKTLQPGACFPGPVAPDLIAGTARFGSSSQPGKLGWRTTRQRFLD